jgi:hypothetical protein
MEKVPNFLYRLFGGKTLVIGEAQFCELKYDFELPPLKPEAVPAQIHESGEHSSKTRE